MDYSFYLKTYTPVYPSLEAYGFQKEDNRYVLRRDLTAPDLYALLTITSEQIEARVIDKAFEEDYIPFGVRGSNCAEKAEVEELLEDVIVKCFCTSQVVDSLIAYLEETYGTKPEFPWDTAPGYCTFKATYSRKWYGIIMNIPQSRLGFEGEFIVNVMNVKLKPETIESVIDGKHFFPAYHMNKKYWISILLDKNVDMEKVKELIAESYSLVEKEKIL